MQLTEVTEIQRRTPTKDQFNARQTAVRLMRDRRYGEAVAQFAQVADVYREDTGFVNDYAETLTATSTSQNVTLAFGLLGARMNEAQSRGEPIGERSAVLMGRAAARGRHYDRALEWYRHARQINPASEEVQFLAARDQAGDNFQEQGLIDGAVALHRQGLQTRGSDPSGALTDFDKALVLFSGQGDPVPNAPWTVFERGETLRAMGLSGEAREDIRRAHDHLQHPDVQAVWTQVNTSP